MKDLVTFIQRKIFYLVITAVSYTIFYQLLIFEHIKYTLTWKIIVLSLVFIGWISTMISVYFRNKRFAKGLNGGGK